MNAPEPIAAGVQTIRLAAIAPSPTNPRKRFDQGALDELAESIRRHGVIQPILVRPNPDQLRGPREEYELVAGERRWRAAQAAELREIPALVRDLTDVEVLEIQVVENLQRADLHPLEEAHGYEALHTTHGYSVADIAAKCGKSAGYVYARMKLTALCEAARKAFYADKLTARTALLIARIPDVALQAKATKEITTPRWSGAEPMTAAQASDHIQSTYMLRLATAPFKPSDAELLPDAGPCTTCPKRTGNAGELFDDIKAADTCTDPGCFQRKTIAHKDRLIAQAEAKGTRVIDGDAAKKVIPHSHSDPKGFVPLDKHEYAVDGNKTVRQLVAKADIERVLIVNPHTHEVIEAVPQKAYADVLVVAGARNTSVSERDRQAKEKAKTTLENTWRLTLFGRLRAPRALELEDRRLIARTMFDHLGHDLQVRVRDVWSWPKIASDNCIDELDAAQLDRLMIDMALISEIKTWAYSTSKPERMLNLAKRLGVDADVIKREVAAEFKAKNKAKTEKAKKAAEKKAPKKKTATKPAKKAAKNEPAAPLAPEQKAAPEMAQAWPFPTTQPKKITIAETRAAVKAAQERVAAARAEGREPTAAEAWPFPTTP